MRRIRVLVGDVPAEVKQWIDWVSQVNPAIEIVGHARDTVTLLLTVSQTDAEVVIAALKADGGEPGHVSHLLGEYPYLIVLALGSDLSSAAIFRLALKREDIPTAEPGAVWAQVSRIVESRC
jgi:hypothetical protein